MVMEKLERRQSAGGELLKSVRRRTPWLFVWQQSGEADHATPHPNSLNQNTHQEERGHWSTTSTKQTYRVKTVHHRGMKSTRLAAVAPVSIEIGRVEEHMVLDNVEAEIDLLGSLHDTGVRIVRLYS